MELANFGLISYCKLSSSESTSTSWSLGDKLIRDKDSFFLSIEAKYFLILDLGDLDVDSFLSTRIKLLIDSELSCGIRMSENWFHSILRASHFYCILTMDMKIEGNVPF
jgi:hypothetical protein